jgi:hypothetical protein
VSFVYNNKLPFYIWGPFDYFTFGGQQADPEGSQILSYLGGIVVPLAEYGPQKLWDARVTTTIPSTLSARRSLIEGTPCDVQMPWKKFVSPASGSDSELLYGLTLHGEIHLFTPLDAAYWAPRTSARARRLQKITAQVASPFSSIGEGEFTIVDLNTNKTLLCAAVTKDGKAWLLGVKTEGFFTSNRVNRTVCDSVTLPHGELARYASFRAGRNVPGQSPQRTIQVLLTTYSNKTYIRGDTSLNWYCLTTGCYDVATLVHNGQRWLWDNLPSFTVDAPASGTRATVEPIWADTGESPSTFPVGMKITNPGSGYTFNPTVTPNRAADVNPTSPATEITLKVFADHVVEAYQRQCGTFTSPNDGILCRGATGRVWYVRIPDHVSQDGLSSTNNIPWASDITPSYQGSTVFVYDFGGGGFVADSAGGHFIGLNKKLYRREPTTNQIELVDDSDWQSVAQFDRVICGVKADGSMWSWGTQGGPRNALFGDETEFGSSRATPVQIASDAQWLSVRSIGGNVARPVGAMVAIRKDAVCRDIDQPMEYWPDWAFG